MKLLVNVQDLTNIEKLFNVSINLYSHSKSDIYPIRITESTASKHVDLLVTTNSKTNHYVWIRDFNKLCYKKTKCKNKKFFCKYCIEHFTNESILQKHMKDCMDLNGCQAIEMPPEGEVNKFKSFRETVKIPFVIYADLESILYKLTVSQKQEMEQTDKLQKHVACSYGYKVVCCYDDRQLRIVRRTLDVDAAHALVRAIIHSRLDYCNSVLAGLPAYMFKRLQSVLNAAARLVLQLPGRQSVTIPMAEKLHWLGFPHRVTYKLCVLIYKGLHGLAPDYLSRRCVRVRDVPGRAHLRSASAGQLMVPITNRRTIGDKGFSHCGPVAWNNLPLHLRSDDCTPSLDCFKKHLKTALFKLTTQK